MAIAPSKNQTNTKPQSPTSSGDLAPNITKRASSSTTRRPVAEKPSGREPANYVSLSRPVIIWITLLHVGALAAPFFFSWQAVVLVVVLHWCTGGIGVCLGFHRLLTHNSFTTYKPVRFLIAWMGGMAGEGSAVDWIANHRKHHALSDQLGDPHSPLDGAWWSHMLWIFPITSKEDHQTHLKRWAPDWVNDAGLAFLNRTFLLWHFLMGGALLAAGYATGGWYLACSFLTWGLFLRLILVLHSTWFVNSASHIWGYRNYATTDDSRNNWWVAIITYGEGWHNNHHAYPRMANHGHRWWEYDMTFRLIRLMQRFGLAWNVVDYKQRGMSGQCNPKFDVGQNEN